MQSSNKSIENSKEANYEVRNYSTQKGRREKTSNPSIFIAKTYQILETPEFNTISSWNEEGTNFTILDVERFEQEILPIYFRHRNFSSFVRQLNMYDFHKVRNEANKSIFEHKFFLKSSKHLLKNIKRKGCLGKKSQETEMDIPSEELPSNFETSEKFLKSEQKFRPTLESISKIPHGVNEAQASTIYLSPVTVSSVAQIKQTLDEFLQQYKENAYEPNEIQEILKHMKSDEKYRCLNSRENIRKIIKNLKKKKPRREELDLEDLSIEEEIFVENLDDQSIGNPSLALVSTQKFLPPKSHFWIDSLQNESLVNLNSILFPRS